MKTTGIANCIAGGNKVGSTIWSAGVNIGRVLGSSRDGGGCGHVPSGAGFADAVWHFAADVQAWAGQTASCRGAGERLRDRSDGMMVVVQRHRRESLNGPAANIVTITDEAQVWVMLTKGGHYVVVGR